MKSSSFFSTGENKVCGYLENNRYSILDRNYRTSFGEIDIIAISPDKTLVFCEVKARKITKKYGDIETERYPHLYGNNVDKLGKVRQSFIPPEQNLTSSKIRKCERIAQWYANQFSSKVPLNGWRIDAVAIVLDEDLEIVSLHHYKNISSD
jgi:Holliday junction resolvase-like predicted endonuclease